MNEIEALYEKLEDFIDNALRTNDANHCARIPIPVCGVLITTSHVYIPLCAVYKLRRSDERHFKKLFPKESSLYRSTKDSHLFVAMLSRLP